MKEGHRGEGHRGSEREYWNGNHEKGQRIISIGLATERAHALRVHTRRTALLCARLCVRVSSRRHP